MWTVPLRFLSGSVQSFTKDSSATQYVSLVVLDPYTTSSLSGSRTSRVRTHGGSLRSSPRCLGVNYHFLCRFRSLPLSGVNCEFWFLVSSKSVDPSFPYRLLVRRTHVVSTLSGSERAPWCLSVGTVTVTHCHPTSQGSYVPGRAGQSLRPKTEPFLGDCSNSLVKEISSTMPLTFLRC